MRKDKCDGKTARDKDIPPSRAIPNIELAYLPRCPRGFGDSRRLLHVKQKPDDGINKPVCQDPFIIRV